MSEIKKTPPAATLHTCTISIWNEGTASYTATQLDQAIRVWSLPVQTCVLSYDAVQVTMLVFPAQKDNSVYVETVLRTVLPKQQNVTLNFTHF
jgi:hypothetical protein